MVCGNEILNKDNYKKYIDFILSENGIRNKNVKTLFVEIFKIRDAIFTSDEIFSTAKMMCDICNISRKSFMTALSKLIELKEVECRTTNKGTIIRLINYKKSVYICDKKNSTQLVSAKSKKTYVYLMFNSKTDKYKIGMTDNLKIRERTLQSEEPDITLFRYRKCKDRKEASFLEKILHTLFLDCRVRGEWFLLSREQVGYILNIMD